MSFLKKIFGAKEAEPAVVVAKPIIDIRKNVINLSKKAKIEIDKKGLSGVKSQVVLVLDISGSMSQMYKNGTVQETVQRLLALGMNFDDDGEIDVILFGNNAYQLPSVTLDNIESYVESEITAKYQINQGTRYGEPLEMIMDKYKANTGDPVFVMFVTDGDNSDKPKTNKLIKELSTESIFFQFVGIGPASFDYLEKLDNLEGRFIDNAGFMQVRDIAGMSEDTLYSELLNEYPSWLKEAKSKDIIKV